MTQVENRVQNIENLLKNAEKNLKKAEKLLETLNSDLKNSFEDVPGTLGTFDGEYMITADGKKYEVNPNYSAKSMLVVGDNLKMIEEGDKKLFKQISKTPRKRLEGILNKKEGKWYALTDAGSYRVLDVAVEFRRGQMNDEIVVLVPESNLNSPYAALERLKNEREVETIAKEKEDVKEEKPKKKAPAKKTVKKEARKEEKSSAPVDSILEDDLV
jgi:hypothetical protein